MDWSAPAFRVDRLVRACTPAPGRLDHVRAGPAQARPGAAGAGRARARAGGAAGREAAGAGRHRRPQPVELGDGRRRRASSRCRRPTGPAASRPAAGSRLGTRGGHRRSAADRAARCRVAARRRDRRAGGRPAAARRPAGRRPGPARPAPRREADPARRVAYDLLRAVDERDAYANLTLPALLRERGLTGRDAAFATELGYGTLRAAGTLDEILARCADRPVERDRPGRRGPRCGWARTSCCAPGCRRTPRSRPPWTWRRAPARPGSSTRCCAGWPGRTGTRGWPRSPRRDAARPAGAAARAPALDRGRVRRRARRRPGRDRRGAGGRRRPAADPPGGPAGPDRPGPAGRAGRRRAGALLAVRGAAAVRRRSRRAGRGPGRAGRRAGRGQPAVRAGAGPGAAGRPGHRAGSTCAPGPGGKAALLGSRSPSGRAADAGLEPRGRAWSWRHRARLVAATSAGCRWTWCARTGPRRPGGRAGPTGSWSTRPAPGSARCAAAPRPAGGAARTTWPS